MGVYNKNTSLHISHIPKTSYWIPKKIRMDNFKQECKLCDNIINDENFKVVEGVEKEIFDILLLKLTLNDTQNVMCTMCSSKLLAALNFKTKCLYTDNTIIPYVDFKNPKPVDLKQIYIKERRSKQGGSMLDDREICRLCLQPISGDHKSIQEVPFGSIEIYIPEINFEATTNPVICIKCHDAVCDHSTFIKNCVDVDRKSNGDAMKCQETFLNDLSIKTEEIEIKSEEIDQEMSPETIRDINKEKHDEGDTSLQSQIDLMNTEESRSDNCKFETKHNNYLKHRSTHKDPAEVQMYMCDKCKFVTKYKGSIKRHSLTHRDSSEVQVFKCEQCYYQGIDKGNLKRHLLRHKNPSEVRMFKCDKCDYKSIHKGHIKQHQLIHKDPSQVQMFKCDECDYKCPYKSNLKHHQLKHKDSSEAQMLACDKCKFTTKYKESLILHFFQHKAPSEAKMFKCDECDYKCVYKNNLKHHQLKHKDPSEVLMHACAQCKFTTKYKESLIQHNLQHKDT